MNKWYVLAWASVDDGMPFGLIASIEAKKSFDEAKSIAMEMATSRPGHKIVVLETICSIIGTEERYVTLDLERQ